MSLKWTTLCSSIPKAGATSSQTLSKNVLHTFNDSPAENRADAGSHVQHFSETSQPESITRYSRSMAKGADGEAPESTYDEYKLDDCEQDA